MGPLAPCLSSSPAAGAPHSSPLPPRSRCRLHPAHPRLHAQSSPAPLLLLQYAPAFLRLALHDALTWDASSRTGGANGSIRTERELTHAGRALCASASALSA